jgi:hypothetical protein
MAGVELPAAATPKGAWSDEIDYAMLRREWLGGDR